MFGKVNAGGLSMGFVFSLYDNATHTSSRIQSSLNKLGAVATNVQTKLDQSFNRMGTGLIALGAAIAVGFPLQKAVQYAGELEQVTMSYTTMLRSAEKAQKLVSDLQYFADVTPFTPTEALNAGQNLLIANIQAEKMIGLMTTIGDVATGARIPFEDLTDFVARAITSETQYFRYLQQLAHRRVPIWDALAQLKGTTKADMFNMVHEGKWRPNADELIEAFKILTTNGGIFTGMMEKQSKTYLGRWSTMVGYYHQMLQAIGMALIPALTKGLEKMATFFTALKNFFETKLGAAIVQVVAVLTALVGVMGVAAIVTAGANIAVMKLTYSYGALTGAMIRTTIAQRGLMAGMKQMIVVSGRSMFAPLLAPLKEYQKYQRLNKRWLAGSTRLPTEGILGAEVDASLARLTAHGVKLAKFTVVLTLLAGAFEMMGKVKKGNAAYVDLVTGGSVAKSGTHLLFLQKLGTYWEVLKQTWKSAMVESDRTHSHIATGIYEIDRATELAAKKLGIWDKAQQWAGSIMELKSFILGVSEPIARVMEVMKRGFKDIDGLFDSLGDGLHTINKYLGLGETRLDVWYTLGKGIGIVLGTVAFVVGVLISFFKFLFGIVSAVVELLYNLAAFKLGAVLTGLGDFVEMFTGGDENTTKVKRPVPANSVANVPVGGAGVYTSNYYGNSNATAANSQLKVDLHLDGEKVASKVADINSRNNAMSNG